jgi:uncharacterized protein (DUF2236 family)
VSSPARLVDPLRRIVIARWRSYFSHAGDPLAHTLSYPGDPGLFGPDSVTWQVMGDAASFLGGIRALMIQAAHPEVVAGVADHSHYREDPLGRLSRTSNYVTATAYGAMPEVKAALAGVRRAHRYIKGVSHRGIPYSADSPEYGAWVHNSLTDSFLVANQVFGARPLTHAEADRFVAEHAALGRLLNAEPLPETADELDRWISEHPQIAPSPGMREAIAFLLDPPVDPLSNAVYRIFARAAAATIPPRVRRVLGFSPAWQLALVRAGRPKARR